MKRNVVKINYVCGCAVLMVTWPSWPGTTLNMSAILSFSQPANQGSNSGGGIRSYHVFSDGLTRPFGTICPNREY